MVLSSSDRNLVHRKGLLQVFSTVVGDLKENLNINIPTKERIANLDIFLFYHKFQNIYKNSFNYSS